MDGFDTSPKKINLICSLLIQAHDIAQQIYEITDKIIPMKNRPKILTFLSSVVGALSLLFPLQTILLFQKNTISLTSLVLFNYLLILIFVATAVSLYRASRMMVWQMPLFSLAGIAYNVFLYKNGLVSIEFLLSMGALFLSIQAIWFSSEVRFICRNPQFRWWRIPKRTKIKTSVYISPMRGEGFSGHTYDISLDGAFIPYDLDLTEKIPEVHPGENVQVRLTLGSLRTVRFEARVVRVQNDILGQYPPGFAICFDGAKREHRRYLESFISLQKQAA